MIALQLLRISRSNGNMYWFKKKKKQWRLLSGCLGLGMEPGSERWSPEKTSKIFSMDKLML